MEVKSFHAKVSNCHNSDSLHLINFKILKYQLIIMRVFGIYHKKSDIIAYKAYPFAIITLFWINIARFMTIYYYSSLDSLNSDLVLNITTTIWYSICAINSTIIFINQECNHREEAFLKHLNILLQSVKEIKNLTKSLKIKFCILYTIGLASGVFNFGLVSVALFGPKVLFDAFSGYLTPFHKSNWALENIPYKLYIAIITVYFSLHWTLAVSYFVTHCMILTSLIKNFNKNFSDLITNNIFVCGKNKKSRKKTLKRKKIWLMKKNLSVSDLSI